MARFEQFEVWAEQQGKWEMVGSFRQFDVATAVAANYTYRMRLVRSIFEDGKRVEQEVIAELGSTRRQP